MRPAFLALLLPLLFAGPAAAAEVIGAPAAQARAVQDGVLLIDIRRPQEWRQSGVAAPARTLSMHEPGFLEGLSRLTGGDRSRPIALICATGARSTWLAGELEKRGYANVLNVREGMFGSQAGPGWLRRGLPVRKVE